MDQNETENENLTLDANKPPHEMDSSPQGAGVPSDRGRLVFWILLLQGVASLLPWNMFFIANDYFTTYKFASPECSDNTTDNVTLTSCADTSGVYRNYFLSYVGFVGMVPNVLFNLVNVFVGVKGGSTRILSSIVVIIAMFILTIVFIDVDTSGWPGEFFWITMTTVVVINMATGLYQNGIFGIAAVLPMKYTNAVVVGANLSGTVTAVTMILSIAATPEVRTSARAYFLTAVAICVVGIVSYIRLPRLEFYRHYATKQTTGGPSVTGQRRRPPYGAIFKKCGKLYFCVWFVFFVTATCFPAILANVHKIDDVDDAFPIPTKYFVPVLCFLFFNLFSLLGCATVELPIRKPGPRFIWIPILLRVLFIPFFVFCNLQPQSGLRGLPVVISSNWAYALGLIAMAYSSGYFSSLSLMYAPGRVTEPEHQIVAGKIASLFIAVGVISGVLFSLPVTVFVEKVN